MSEENCDFMEVVPISEEEYDNLISLQQAILELLAKRGDYKKTLEHLCAMAESLLPNSVASIMMLDEVTGLMNVLSAPSVPQVGHDALAGLKPGIGGGSCGNAVFSNQPQYVANTFKDSRWENIRQIAYDFNLCSCWSMPIRDVSGDAIGSFALSSFEHRAPSSFHRKLLETGAAIVGIVLQTVQDQRRINILASAIDNASEGVIITDAKNNIIEVNQAFRDIYGYQDEDVLNKNPRILASGEHSTEFYEEMWESICNEKHWSGEITNKKSNGDEIDQWMSVSAISKDGREAENFLAIFTDITELKQARKRIEYMMMHDTLTQLWGKNALESHLNNTNLSTLITVNIDNFSYFNMAYGFKTGDILLKHIAKTLTENFSEANIYRIDSDEFALLYDGERDTDLLMKEIQFTLNSSQAEIDDIIIHSTVSCGGSVGQGKSIIKNATLALKIAKNRGKNQYVSFDEKINISSKTERDHFIKANHILRQAINENLFIPYYHGIRENHTGELIKYEALVRIELEDKVISPAYFLETAHLSGLLPEITKIMIDKTFAFLSDNEIHISLNIAEDDLNQNYLVPYLEKKLTQYNLEAKRITLEILEGVSAKGKDSSRLQLMQLKKMGFQLAIDDFGTEYSNFERLLDMDIDLLKIDGRYIKDIDVNKKSFEIVKAIAGFAKNAGIKCVAEFVHSDSVQQVIEQLDIEYSQGFLFCEPIPSLGKK